MDNILQLNEFFVEGGRQEMSHVLLHITEPSTPEEMRKGYFFAICEINNAETKYIAKLQDLIDKAENDYYELADEGGKTSLEMVVEKINQEAYSLLKPEIELHCILGAIRSPEIIFTFYGQPELLLFYKNRQGIYQTMDLLHDDADEPKNETTQLFSQLVQGKVSPEDYLFAGTPHIIEYFNRDRLAKIITTRPAAQSAGHLERVLTDLKNGFSFGGLIIHLVRAVETANSVIKKSRPMTQGGSTASLNNLFNTERGTADTLSPSLLPRLFGSSSPQPVQSTADNTINKAKLPVAEINSAHLKAHRPKTAAETERSSSAEMLAAAGTTALKGLVAVGRVLLWILIGLYSLVYGLFRNFILLFFVITNYHNRRKTILENWRRGWRSMRENMQQLPTITKMLLFAASLIALIFIASLVYIHYRQQQVARTNAFNAAVQLITNEKNTAEGELTYRNPNALNDFQAAQNTLNGLACLSVEQKNTCSSLQSQLTDLGSRLRKITTVSPVLITDETSQLQGATITGLIKVGTKLITYSTNTSTLFIYDLLSKQLTALPTGITIPGFTAAAVPKENDYALFIYGQKNLLRLDPTTNNTKPIDITYPSDAVNITGAAIYNRRLYLLDSAHSQIYRHDPIQTGFGQGSLWLTSSAPDLNKGVGLTIDGDIYILENNGHIAKFTSGATDPFTIQGLDPALTSGNALWTYNGVDNLYVLDGSGKRLLILTKDGRLTAQLMSPLFQNPSGLSIDTASQSAYVMDSGKLYKIALPTP